MNQREAVRRWSERRIELERVEQLCSCSDPIRATIVRHSSNEGAKHSGARLLDASIDGELLPPLSLEVLQRLASGAPFGNARLRWQSGTFTASLD